MPVGVSWCTLSVLMKIFAEAVRGPGQLRSQRVSSAILFSLLASRGAAQTVPKSVPSGVAAIQSVGSSPDAAKFTDVTSALNINFVYVASHTSRKYLIETMGSGVALFDYDNDGRLDIFVINGAPLSDPTPKGMIPKKAGPKDWNRLFHQKKDGTFEDVKEKAGLQGVGYGMGVAVGDYDNDGFEDLYVTAYGGNKLYHNNGDGTFADVTERAGVAGSGWSTSAAWVDLDGDGLLDLVVLRYLQWDFDDIYCGERREGYRSYCHPDSFRSVAPLVYHNAGMTGNVGKEIYGAGESIWMYLMFEALGHAGDRELMLVNLDLLDATHSAEFPAQKLNFILYNPTPDTRSAKLTFSAANGRPVRPTANGKAATGTLEVQKQSFIRLLAEVAG
jgi:hypothetical protein